MVAASPNDRPSCSSSDPAFIELVTYSAKAMAKKDDSQQSITAAPPSSHRPVQSAGIHPSTAAIESPEDYTFGDLIFGQENSTHAAPLPALRDRDLIALAELFESADMAAIEADILANLALRYPEPCWEDSPFDFLQDFL